MSPHHVFLPFDQARMAGEPDASGRPHVVIDAGSFMTKAGLSSDTDPRVVFRTVVGLSLQNLFFIGMGQKSHYFGDEALTHPRLSLKFPVRRGRIVSWDDMDALWHHTFYNALKLAPEEHRVLMVERTNSWERSDREKCVQIVFETYSVPAIYLVPSATCVAFGAAPDPDELTHRTGLVLESGHDLTRAVPVYGGYVIPHDVQTLYAGGDDVTSVLERMIGLSSGWTTSADRNTLRAMKEKLCFVARDYTHELWHSDDTQLRRTYTPPAVTAGDSLDTAAAVAAPLTISTERMRAPEAMFDTAHLPSPRDDYDYPPLTAYDTVRYQRMLLPYLDEHIPLPPLAAIIAAYAGEPANSVRCAGVHHLVHDAISSANRTTAVHPEFVSELLGNVLLSGGNTLFPGMSERLQRELSAMPTPLAGTAAELGRMPPPATIAAPKVRVIPAVDTYSVWRGAARLARSNRLEPIQNWIRYAEYEEYGPAIVHRKCMGYLE